MATSSTLPRQTRTEARGAYVIEAKRFGSGGTNLVPGRAGGPPALADVLRDISDDLRVARAELARTQPTGPGALLDTR